MVVTYIEKEKIYTHNNLLNLGFKKSKLPYANFKVYIKNHMFYLFREVDKNKLIFDSINH